MLSIEVYESDLLKSNMYLVSEGNHAIVIDPFRDVSPAEGKTVDWIIVTHEHYDHISGVNMWKEKYGCRLICSRACAKNITSPRKNMASLFEVFCELQSWVQLDGMPDSDPEYSCSADEEFEDRLLMKWQDHTVELLEIPGHSQGSIGICIDGKHFFSGDSLIKNTPVELRLPGGSKSQWEKTGRKIIEEIPKGTTVWPGHFESFSL